MTRCGHGPPHPLKNKALSEPRIQRQSQARVLGTKENLIYDLKQPNAALLTRLTRNVFAWGGRMGEQKEKYIED